MGLNQQSSLKITSFYFISPVLAFHLLQSLDLRLVLLDGLLPHHDLLLVLLQLVLLIVQLDAQAGLLGLELKAEGAGQTSGQGRAAGPTAALRSTGSSLTASWRSRSASSPSPPRTLGCSSRRSPCRTRQTPRPPPKKRRCVLTRRPLTTTAQRFNQRFQIFKISPSSSCRAGL